MQLRSHLGRMRNFILTALYRRVVALGDLGPVVTFTFDDFPQSAVTNGASILESHQARATFYTAMGLMNSKNRLGRQFSNADLHSLVERGHEVAMHGFSHISARRVPCAEFLADVKRCEHTLTECVHSGASHNFAYPYGEATLRTKRRLGPLTKSSRGTVPGFNGPGVDLNLLRANFLYGDISQLDRAQQLIRENQARHSWLIFYSHDVTGTPSPFGCTPALLEQTVSFALKCGARVLTVAEVVQVLCHATGSACMNSNTAQVRNPC